MKSDWNLHVRVSFVVLRLLYFICFTKSIWIIASWSSVSLLYRVLASMLTVTCHCKLYLTKVLVYIQMGFRPLPKFALLIKRNHRWDQLRLHCLWIVNFMRHYSWSEQKLTFSRNKNADILVEINWQSNIFLLCNGLLSSYIDWPFSVNLD